MNKSLLLCMATSLALFAGCAKEDGGAPVRESLKLDTTELTLDGPDAGSSEIVLFCSNVTPSVSSDAQWLTAEITTRVLTVRYEANDGEEPRTATLTVSAGSLDDTDVTVIQPGKGSGEVKPGEDGLVLGGLTSDGKGVVYYISPDDPTAGLAISIDCVDGSSQTALWATVSGLVGADSRVDGASNTAKLLSAPDAEASYPAAWWCAALGEGWYMPALEEVLKIREIYAADKDTFDGWLTSNGGLAMNVGKGSYWTSTESSADEAWWVKISTDKDAEAISKTSKTRTLRAIRVIGEYKRPAEPVSLSLSKSSLSFGSEAASESVSVTVKNGTLSSSVAVSDDAASWLGASVDGETLIISVKANDSGAARSGSVTLTAAGAQGASEASATVKVEQKAPEKADGFKLLDTWSENGRVVGVVFWVSEDGMSAKVVSLKRSANIAWAVAGSVSRADVTLIEGAADKSDGQANTDAIRAFVKDSYDDVPALAYIDGLGEGWYWPAAYELQALFEAYNGTSYDNATNSKPDGISEDEKSSRARFEQVLADNGGDKINAAAGSGNGEQYLASTQVDAKQVYSFRFGKRSLNNDTGKTGTTRMVRAVKLVKKVL